MMTQSIPSARAKRKPGEEERFRRVRLGELRRIMQHRYRRNSCVLSEDDGGRDDLYLLLLTVSLGEGRERKMKNTIDLWAPWMSQKEAEQTIDNINRTPLNLRLPKARELADRLRLTDQERTAYGIITIKPCDLTDEQMLERRKVKKAAYKWHRRRAAGKKEREQWLSNCKSRTKPWERRKMSRRTWYRERAKERTKVAQLVGTGVDPIKLVNSGDRPVPLRGVRGLKRNSRRSVVVVEGSSREKKRARGGAP